MAGRSVPEAFHLGPASAFAQSGQVVATLNPQVMTLSDRGTAMDIQLQGAPELSSFQVDVNFDPATVAVTAVEADRWSAGSGAKSERVPLAAAPGKLTVGAKYSYDSPANPNAPPAGGVVARITFAPLAVGGTPVSFSNILLRNRSGEAIPLSIPEGQIQVPQPPSEEMRTAALQQASALTSTTGASLLPNFGAAAGGLGQSVRQLGWSGVWVAILVAALAVVAAGWYVGRRA